MPSNGDEKSILNQSDLFRSKCRLMKLNNNVKQATELEIGQLWKVGDFHIEIVQIGKTLCHYRHLRNLGQKGIPVKLEQLQVVKKYLKTNKAELVGNKKKKTARK